MALLNGNHSTNVSTVISELVNLTKPGNELRLDKHELSSSLDVLVLLVTFNSEVNNSIINTSVDQQNIVQVASNLLEEVNSNTWLQLQKVLSTVAHRFERFKSLGRKSNCCSDLQECVNLR